MARDLGQKWGDPFDLIHMFFLMADIKIAVGDFTGAQHAFEKGEEVLRSHEVSPGLIDWGQAACARYWLKRDNLEAAIRWGQDSGISATDEILLNRTNQYRTRARVYLATEKYEAALELLNRLQERVEAAGRTRSLLQTLVLRGLAHQALKDTPQALGVLERALTLAQPGGFIRIFVDEGPPMAALLRRAGSQGIAPQYVAALLSEFPEPLEDPESSTQPLIEPLSQRELEILGCLAEGLSNQEIAERLIIALGTVKAHTVSIYRKLNVNRRTHAVARARELNLL
jgi:LuxR family maltose regulon positive regulatory protein